MLSVYDKTYISFIGQRRIITFTKNFEEAKDSNDVVGMSKAHQRAERIRKRHGYSGGPDGSQYLPVGG